MRGLRTGTLIASLCAAAALAQEPVPPHAPDGFVRQQVQSISILSVPNAPFSATVVTELTTLLPDGTTSTMKNHRTVARDSAGRVFQERRFFSPTGDVEVTRLGNLQYQDPNRHEYYDCHPVQRTCFVYPYSSPPGNTATKVEAANSKDKNVTVEDLGRRTLESVEVLGSRETTTIAAGVIGNKNPQPIVKEFWYSPHLQVNLIVKRFDPRSGMQNFDVTNLNLSEPDPKTLSLPAGYQIVKANPGQR